MKARSTRGVFHRSPLLPEAVVKVGGGRGRCDGAFSEREEAFVMLIG